MATIRSLSNGRFRTNIRFKTQFIKSKTFPRRQQAEDWASDFDAGIDKIIHLSSEEIQLLTPVDIDLLGGADLFKKLGVALPEVYTLAMIADEFMYQWQGKDSTMPLKVAFWIDHFGDKPIQASTPPPGNS